MPSVQQDYIFVFETPDEVNFLRRPNVLEILANDWKNFQVWINDSSVGWLQTLFLRNPKNQNYRKCWLFLLKMFRIKNELETYFLTFLGGMGFSRNFKKIIFKLVPPTLRNENFQKAYFHWNRNKNLTRRVVRSKTFTAWLKNYESCSIFGTSVKILFFFENFDFSDLLGIKSEINHLILHWIDTPGLGLCGQL